MSYSQFDINDLWKEFGFRSTEQIGTLYSLEINFLSNRGDASQRHESDDLPAPRRHNLFVKVGYSRFVQLADYISRVNRDTINRLLSKAKTHKDPEGVLEQPILHLQQDLIQLRDAIARASATQKSIEQEYYQYKRFFSIEINLLQSRCNENLTAKDFANTSEDSPQESLIIQKNNTERATVLKAQLDEQTALVNSLNHQMIVLECKLSEAQTKKAVLNSSVAAAQANEQLVQLWNIIDCLEPSWEIAIHLCEIKLTSETVHIINEKILQLDARLEARFLTIAVLICWKEELTNWKSQLLYRLILAQREDLRSLTQLFRQLRQLVDTRLLEQAIDLIVAHKRNQLQYRQVQRLAIRCRECAQFALQEADENRAREWLIRKNSAMKMAGVLNTKLGEQIPLVEELKQNLKEWVNKFEDDEQTPLQDEIKRQVKELKPKIAEFRILYGRVIDSIKIVRASQS